MNGSTENYPREDIVRFYYQQSCEIFKNLADIRFKLLALVPLISGTGVAFLTANPAEVPLPVSLAGGIFGLLITLGVTIYDHRNTQFMYIASNRASTLEKELSCVMHGYFTQWPDKKRIMGISIGANSALIMIYATAMAAWVFVVFRTLFAYIWKPNDCVAMLVALIMAVCLCWYLYRLDDKLKKSAETRLIAEGSDIELSRYREFDASAL